MRQTHLTRQTTRAHRLHVSDALPHLDFVLQIGHRIANFVFEEKEEVVCDFVGDDSIFPEARLPGDRVPKRKVLKLLPGDGVPKRKTSEMHIQLYQL